MRRSTGSSTATVSTSASHGARSMPTTLTAPRTSSATPSSSLARRSAPGWSPRSRWPTKVGTSTAESAPAAEQLEEQVGHRVGALEGVAQVGGAEDRGDDQHPAAADHTRHRRCGTHARRGPDDGARAPVRRGHGPCHAGSTPSTSGPYPKRPTVPSPQRPTARARWRPGRRSAPGRRRWRTRTDPSSNAPADHERPRSTASPSGRRRGHLGEHRRAPRRPRTGATSSIAAAPGRRQRRRRSR